VLQCATPMYPCADILQYILRVWCGKQKVPKGFLLGFCFRPGVSMFFGEICETTSFFGKEINPYYSQISPSTKVRTVKYALICHRILGRIKTYLGGPHASPRPWTPAAARSPAICLEARPRRIWGKRAYKRLN
jgi:hypothetical protein